MHLRPELANFLKIPCSHSLVLVVSDGTILFEEVSVLETVQKVCMCLFLSVVPLRKDITILKLKPLSITPTGNPRTEANCPLRYSVEESYVLTETYFDGLMDTMTR